MRLPYTGVEFTKSGDPAHQPQIDAAVSMIATATDVLVMAHGWNNDRPAAERLFTRLADNIDRLQAGRADVGRSLAVVGVVWPSLRWGSDAADIAGQGLAEADPVLDLIGLIANTVEDRAAAARLTELVSRLDESPEARAEFLAILREQLPPPAAVADDDAPPSTLREGSPSEVFTAAGEAELDLARQLGALPATPAPDDNSPFATLPDPLAGTGTAGAGFFDFLKLNPVQAAGQLLNTTTFYTMKERAGIVGARGVTALLNAVHHTHPAVRVHLIGHSFGARVVAMAAARTDTPISSVSLLQGAFSHRGLAARDPRLHLPDGAFRRALTGGQLTGPLVVTHTHNDKAVGLAYALASRLAHQVAAGLGDASDPYGGLGANGAVGTGAVPGVLGDEHTTYRFQGGQVHNLQADKFIANHSDVTNLAVANAVLAAASPR